VAEEKPVEKVVEKAVLETPVLVGLESEEEAAAREGSRRRGRRGGRRERERRDVVAPETTGNQVETNPEAPIVVQVGATKRKPSEYIALPKSMREQAAEALAQSTLNAADTLVEVAVPVVAEVESVAKVMRTGATLVQIETDPVKTVSAPSVPHNQAGSSRRRARQREVYVENEPLVQIETQH
jgi:ribonuclease E